MPSRWTLGKETYAIWNVYKVIAEKCLGFYRLKFSFSGSVKPNANIFLSNFSCEVSAKTPNTKASCLGSAQFSPLILSTTDENWYFSLTIDVTTPQIEALERLRSHGNLMLIFNLQYTRNMPGYPPSLSGVQMQHTIAQSDWIALLNEMGYQDTILIELPSRRNGKEIIPQTCIGHLQRARNLYLIGEYDSSVIECRRAMECIENHFPYTETTKKKRSDLDKTERLDILRKSLIKLMHPAAHADPVSSKISWNRIDAHSILAMTASLVSMVAETHSEQ